VVRHEGVVVTADEWVRSYVAATHPIELAHDRPWARVWRVPVGDTTFWFKECAPVQGFEPALTAALYERWPDLIPEVVAHDVERRWLLLADGGTSLRALGNPLDAWLTILPRYAELQRGEAAHAEQHLRAGVPDLRVDALPARYEERLLATELPLHDDELAKLREFAPRFAELCDALTAFGVAPSVQHDDLHDANVFVAADEYRVIDWGDASISHPFATLVVAFRVFAATNGLRPDDVWFARLRDAYLEPWGQGLVEAFNLAFQVGEFAHAIAWARQRSALPIGARATFDERFRGVLAAALRFT
jgi:hypothetical protein